MRQTFLARIVPTMLMLSAVAAILAVALGQSADTAAGAPSADASIDPAQLEAEMIRRNGPIFQNWPRPKAALVLTGLLDGYVEPCGCSGKENQKGGLSRRDMLLRRLAADKWPTVAMDLGGVVRRFGRQQEVKYQTAADALKTMGYRVIGFGPDDLRLSAAELLAIVSPTGNQPSPFVSANVGVFGFDDSIVPPFQVVEAGGMKIGVTSVLGDEYRRRVNNQDIQFKPAAAALAEVVPKLQAAKCDILVLLAHATAAESRTLAEQFPQFNVVVSAGGAPEPPAQPLAADGATSMIVEVGSKGMYAIVLGLYDNKPDSIRYQRVPLDARFGESPRMNRALASYQDQLKELGLEGLGLKPMAHSSGRKFVGSQACAECHTKAYAVWNKTPHAHALETLVNLDPPRQYDPECLSCHVTGWEPQKYVPFGGGFLSIEKTPLLAGNGCENCHGPGSSHVAAETEAIRASEADKSRYRTELRMSLKTEAQRQKVIDNCLQCHDADNSIAFEHGDAFDTYWSKVEHRGKD